MSANWIKLRDDLDTDPRIFSMGEHLRLSAQSYILTQRGRDLFGDVTDTVTRDVLRDVTVSALCRVWFAANRHTTDGVFKNATLDYLDTLAQVPGFGQAMAAVGYAIHDPEAHTVTLPRFEEYNAPNKNGQRSKTLGAKRTAEYRRRIKEAEEKEALAKASPDSYTPPKERESDASRDVTCDVTASISSSTSKSTVGTLSDSDSEPKAAQPPADRDPLGTLKKRINALRPCWAKAAHWNAEEEHALFEARHNLAALEDQDWHLLAWFFKWANSAQNTGARTPVPVTARRHHFVSELSATLDRATTAWKQNNCPKLGDATKPTAKPKPPPAPKVPPAGVTDIFRKLASDLGIPARPESTPPASPTTASTLPPPDFDSPAYQALVAAQTPQTAHTASAA